MKLAAPSLALTLMALAALTACVPAQSPIVHAASLAHPRASEIWADKCGVCHIPVEPGTRSRDVIAPAMERHHARVQLAPDEWRDLVEFLTFDAAAAPEAAPPAPTPATP